MAIAACGGGSTSSTPSTPSNRARKAGEQGSTAERGPERYCERIEALGAQGCAPFDTFGLDHAACVEDLRRSLDERGDDARVATTKYGECLERSTCDAVTRCIGALESIDGGYRACSDHGSSAVVGVPRADYDRRRGATAKLYSDVPSSKAGPIEVCTIEAEMEWLMRMVCDDGSRPFPSADHAHAARVGNVGRGGTCGSIIDLYEVPCPEGTYSIYMDAYVCPI
jgi:hypothetical protein